MPEASISVPRSLRIRFWFLRAARWLVPAGAVLDLAVGREAEPLLRAFVCLLLGHGWNLRLARIQYSTGLSWTRKGGMYQAHSVCRPPQKLRHTECACYNSLTSARRSPQSAGLASAASARAWRLGSSSLVQPLDQLVAFVDVGVFAAAEDDGEDHLVLLGQELLGAVDLGHQVVVADLGAEAQLFVLAVVRVAFVLPLLLLVLEFAVIHDPANGRLLLRRDFHEVQADFAGTLQGLDGFDDAEYGRLPRR